MHAKNSRQSFKINTVNAKHVRKNSGKAVKSSYKRLFYFLLSFCLTRSTNASGVKKGRWTNTYSIFFNILNMEIRAATTNTFERENTVRNIWQNEYHKTELCEFFTVYKEFKLDVIRKRAADIKLSSGSVAPNSHVQLKFAISDSSTLYHCSLATQFLCASISYTRDECYYMRFKRDVNFTRITNETTRSNGNNRSNELEFLENRRIHFVIKLKKNQIPKSTAVKSPKYHRSTTPLWAKAGHRQI